MCGDGCKIQGKCYMLYQMSVCHHEGSLPHTIIQFMIIFSCMSIVSLSMHIIKLAGLILANGEKNHQNCQNETPPQLPVTNSIFPTASTQIMIIIFDIYINN